MINKEINTNMMEDGSTSFHPHARQVGNFLFVSGIIPRTLGKELIPGVIYDDKGEIIGHDIDKQFVATLENLKHVLKAANKQTSDF